MLDPGKTVGEVGERALVRHLIARLPAGPGVRIGPGDDAAAVETTALTLVTSDAFVEGRHFHREWAPPRLIGRKLLTVNLSDIASMSGAPSFAIVNLFLPPETTIEFVDGLYDGLLERAAETGVSIIGGNIAGTTGPMVLDVTLLGIGDALLTRDGAKPGDLLVCTGFLGAAAQGIELLQQGARLAEDGELIDTGIWTPNSAPAVHHCLRAQLDPAPPLAFGRALAEHAHLVHAAMDLSDGLSSDLLSMCESSRVFAIVDADKIPLDPNVRKFARARALDATSYALHGGEDYQLLLAVAPESLEGVKDLAIVWDMPLAVIGEFSEGPPAISLKRGERLGPLPAGGHDHFRSKPRVAKPERATKDDEAAAGE